MKTLHIALASLLIVASAAPAASLKGSIKTGPHEGLPVGFGNLEYVVNANQKGSEWGPRSPWADHDSRPTAGYQKKSHSGPSWRLNHPRWRSMVTSQEVSSDVPTEFPRLAKDKFPGGHGLHGVPPNLVEVPVTPVSLLQVTATSGPSQPVPDSGNSLVILGLSALGLGGVRRVLRKW